MVFQLNQVTMLVTNYRCPFLLTMSCMCYKGTTTSKVCKKCSEKQNNQGYVPTQPPRLNREPFKVNFARTERLNTSAIPYMQRLLNAKKWWSDDSWKNLLACMPAKHKRQHIMYINFKQWIIVFLSIIIASEINHSLSSDKMPYTDL